MDSFLGGFIYNRSKLLILLHFLLQEIVVTIKYMKLGESLPADWYRKNTEALKFFGIIFCLLVLMRPIFQLFPNQAMMLPSVLTIDLIPG